MHNIVQLQKAILLCLARKDYKVVFCTSNLKTKEDLLRYAAYDKTLMCTVKFTTGEICFDNGAKIVVKSPEGLAGMEINSVFIDEYESMTVDKINQLRAMARK